MKAVVRIVVLLLTIASVSACVIDDGHHGWGWREGHYDR